MKFYFVVGKCFQGFFFHADHYDLWKSENFNGLNVKKNAEEKNFKRKRKEWSKNDFFFGKVILSST